MKTKRRNAQFVPPYTYMVYGTETVVYDKNGRRVVGCPIEQEAIEYIEEHQIQDEGLRVPY